MRYQEVDGGRSFVTRLETGADWRAEIESFADEAGIDAGFFFGLGAVEDAELYYYDQEDQEYTSTEFGEPLEVATCVGNVAWLDGDRFAHTHVVCSREDGSSVAGHLEGATVFAGELYLRELDVQLDREPNETTGLDLWML
jgi:predicted DNA-binding protein with PD1-like motif